MIQSTGRGISPLTPNDRAQSLAHRGVAVVGEGVARWGVTDLSPRQGDSEPPRPVWRPVRPNSLITRLQMSRTSGNVSSYGITINLCRQMLPIPEMSSIVIKCHQFRKCHQLSSIYVINCHQFSSKMSRFLVIPGSHVKVNRNPIIDISKLRWF